MLRADVKPPKTTQKLRHMIPPANARHRTRGRACPPPSRPPTPTAARAGLRPCVIARSTARKSPPGTVRSHGSTPNPDVIASFHAFFPNSNHIQPWLAYTL